MHLSWVDSPRFIETHYLHLMLYDNHGRIINYLRLAVTDRCNLRCQYCMPECGIDFTAREQLMTYEELLRVTRIFSKLGISKIRITGGEPFVRKDLMDFLNELSDISEVDQIHITSNGTLLKGHIQELKSIGIQSINLSLDSLDRDRFYKITRRDDLDIVLENMHALLDADFKVKINTVVMADENTEDIIPMLELAREHNLSVRFLEEMPFNGTGDKLDVIPWTHFDILNHIKTHFPSTKKIVDAPHATAANYSIEGFKGSFGIIASYTRTFCGTCNRIRLTPQGMLKTCLYDQGVFNLRDLIRAGANDHEIETALLDALGHRARDGHEAERQQRNQPISESMASIGG